MRTVIEEMYNDARNHKEMSFENYLTLEWYQMIIFAMELGVPREVAEQHFNQKYDTTRSETTTIFPNIPE